MSASLSKKTVDVTLSLKHAAGIACYDNGETIAIWPRGATRGGTIPLVSLATGLIGYPMAMAGGLKLRTLFNPALHMGGRFRLETSLKGISGIWTINQVIETLAAEMPEGRGSAMSAPIRWPLAAAASDPPRHRAAPTRAAG